ncbi:MAG: putative sugar O-methyltransferase [Planctomycetota bacterium]|jgi:hypothetical protein
MKPIQIDSLPNPRLISELFEAWKGYEDSGASSHWKKFGPQSEVGFENEVIEALRGVGFGDCQVNGGISSKLFHFGTILSYLVTLSDRSIVLPWMRCARSMLRSLDDLDMFFSYDVFRQCCVASILEPYIVKWKNPKILFIGDGYGILAGLLKSRFTNGQAFLVDIFPALLFQAIILGTCLPELKHSFEDLHKLRGKGDEKQSAAADFIYCHGGDLSVLKDQAFDLVINVASMQEMHSDVVAGYFTFIRSHLNKEGLFYCCNREEKVLPDGEILRFMEYPWHEMDKHLLDGEPKFYRHFFSHRPTLRQLKVRGISVPFCRLFDGPMHHRLTRLSPITQLEPR